MTGAELLRQFDDVVTTVWFMGDAKTPSTATWVGQSQHASLNSALEEVQRDAGRRAPYDVIVHANDGDRHLTADELKSAMEVLQGR
jgi:hypothetical protein